MRRSVRLRGDDGTDDDEMDDWSLSPRGSGTGINIMARHVTVVTAKPQVNNQAVIKRNSQRRGQFDNPWRQWKEVETLSPNDIRNIDFPIEEELPPYYLCGPAPEEMAPFEVKHTRRSIRQQQAWARNDSRWPRDESWGGGSMNRGPLSAFPPQLLQGGFPPYGPHPPQGSPPRGSTPQLPSPIPSPTKKISPPLTTHLFTYCRPDTCCPKSDIVSMTGGQGTKINVQYQQCPAVNSSRTFLVVPLRLRRQDDDAVVRTAGAVARAVDASSVVVVRQQRAETGIDTGSTKRSGSYDGASPSSQHPTTQPPLPPPPPTPPPPQEDPPPKYTSNKGPLTGGGGTYGYKDVLPPDGESLVSPTRDATPVPSKPESDIPSQQETFTPAQETNSLIPQKPSTSPEHTTVGTQYSDIEVESKKSHSSVSEHRSETSATEHPVSKRGVSPQTIKVHSQFTITSTIEEIDCNDETKDLLPRPASGGSQSSSCSSDIPLALPCVSGTAGLAPAPDVNTGEAPTNKDDGHEESDDLATTLDQMPCIDDLGPLAKALREALRLCTQLQSNCIPESMDRNNKTTSQSRGRRRLGGGDSSPELDSVQEQNVLAEREECNTVDGQSQELIRKESINSHQTIGKKPSNIQRRHEQLKKMTQLRQLQLDHVLMLRKRLQEQQRKRAAKAKKLKEVKENEEQNEENNIIVDDNLNKKEEFLPPETTQELAREPDHSNIQYETNRNDEEEKQQEKQMEKVSFELTEKKEDLEVKESTEDREDEGSSDDDVGKNTETNSVSTDNSSIQDKPGIKKKKKKRVKSPSQHSSIDDSSSNYPRPPTPYYPWRSTVRFENTPTHPKVLEREPDEEKSRSSPDPNSALSDTGGDKESSFAGVYSSSQSSKDEYKPGTPTLTFFGRRPALSELESTPPQSSERTSEKQWIPVHSTNEPFPLTKRSSSAFTRSPSRRVIQLTRSSRPSSENTRTLSSRANSSTPISSSLLHQSTENIFQRPPHWPSPFSSEKQSAAHSSVEQLKNYSRDNTLSSSSISSECLVNKQSLDLAPSRRTTPTGLPSQLSVARSTSFEVEMTSTDRLVAEISHEIGALPPSRETTISLREGKHLTCYDEAPDNKSRTVDRHRQLSVQHGEQVWDQPTKRGPRSVRGGQSKTRGRGGGRTKAMLQVRWLLPPTPPRGPKGTPSTANQDPVAAQTSNAPAHSTVPTRASSRHPSRLPRGKKQSRTTGAHSGSDKNHLGKSALRLLPQTGNDKWSLRAVTTTTMVSSSVRSGARSIQRNGGTRWRNSRPSPSPAAPSNYMGSPARTSRLRSTSQPHVEHFKERHPLARTSRSSRSPAFPPPGAPKRRSSMSRPPAARTPSVNVGRCVPRGAAFSRINSLQQMQKGNPTPRLLGKDVGKDLNLDTLVSNIRDSSGISLSTEGLRAVIQEITNKTEGINMRPDCGEGSPVASRSPFRKPEELISQIMIEASAAANANSCVRPKVKTLEDCKKQESVENKGNATAEGGNRKEMETPCSANSSLSGNATSVNTQTSYMDLPLQVPRPLKIPGLAGCVRCKTEKLLQELIQRNSARDMASGNQEN